MADALATMRARRAQRIASSLPSSRTCGACDVCCTAPAIREMGKPPGVRCQHLQGEPGRSCSVYRSRPKVCLDFHCVWRMSDHILPDWLWPARCGFMMAFNNPFEWPGVVTVHELPERRGEWRNPWAMTVFVTLAERWNCLVAIGQVPVTTHVFCPNGSVLDVATSPRLMREDTGTIGAPDFVFGPDRRPIVERLGELAFVWSLAPPPE